MRISWVPSMAPLMRLRRSSVLTIPFKGSNCPSWIGISLRAFRYACTKQYKDIPVRNPNLNDEQPNLRVETASTLATLREAASPYGIRSLTTPYPEARWKSVKALASLKGLTIATQAIVIRLSRSIPRDSLMTLVKHWVSAASSRTQYNLS